MGTEKIKIFFLRVFSWLLKALLYIPKPIMAPFSSTIRYWLLKFMKRFSRSDDPRPSIAAANHLIDEIMPKIFIFFQDEKFRNAAGFEKLDQNEHDRIFNELEMAAFCICLFCLEQRETFIGQEDFHFWKGVRKQIPLQLEQKFLDLGVGEENARLIRKLMNMRCQEYEKIASGNRQYFDEQEDFRKYGEFSKEMMARVQATAVGTSDHILRGKLKPDAEILRVMRQWLFPLDLEIVRFIKKL